MKLVQSSAEMPDQMQLAINEATSSFGNGAVFIEKFVTSPRHIEIQVLADSFGNTVYVFERECSIQRRHQKVVEEAPSAILTPEIRKAMGDAAVKVAKAVPYISTAVSVGITAWDVKDAVEKSKDSKASTMSKVLAWSTVGLDVVSTVTTATGKGKPIGCAATILGIGTSIGSDYSR